MCNILLLTAWNLLFDSGKDDWLWPGVTCRHTENCGTPLEVRDKIFYMVDYEMFIPPSKCGEGVVKKNMRSVNVHYCRFNQLAKIRFFRLTCNGEVLVPKLFMQRIISCSRAGEGVLKPLI